MCFYDQYLMACGDYKWGHFKQHCSTEHRIGETCGIKLVKTTIRKEEKCKICQKIDLKHGRLEKEEKRIERWTRELELGIPRAASIEVSEAIVSHLEGDIMELEFVREYDKRFAAGPAPVFSSHLMAAGPLETSGTSRTHDRSSSVAGFLGEHPSHSPREQSVSTLTNDNLSQEKRKSPPKGSTAVYVPHSSFVQPSIEPTRLAHQTEHLNPKAAPKEDVSGLSFAAASSGGRSTGGFFASENIANLNGELVVRSLREKIKMSQQQEAQQRVMSERSAEVDVDRATNAPSTTFNTLLPISGAKDCGETMGHRSDVNGRPDSSSHEPKDIGSTKLSSSCWESEHESGKSGDEERAGIQLNSSSSLYGKSPITRSSSTDSLQSLVDSIFSGATFSSTSTVPGEQDALQRILGILRTDLFLSEVYKHLVAKMSPRKFNRNLGTLLKKFAVELEREATCWNEQRAAQFIRCRARKIAQKVTESTFPSNDTSVVTILPEKQEEIDSSESELEEDTESFQELEHFVTSSKAFENLRRNIQNFMGTTPINVSLKKQSPIGTCFDNLMTVLPFAEEGFSPEVVGETNLSRQDNWRQSSWWQMAKDKVFPEPVVPDGMVRVRWQCPCGDSLYDDYTELKPGAAKRLEDFLRRSSHRQANSGTNNSQKSHKIARSISNMFTSLTLLLQSSPKDSTLPNTELRNYSDARATRFPAHASGDVFYLLLCHNSGVGAEVVQVRQPDVCDIDSDTKLFQFLHDEYVLLREHWWSFISLWTLKSIRFVRFELFENELVHVQKVDDVPPPTRDHEYRHGPPNPPETNPPLGPTLLLHLFKHPELAGKQKRYLKKIPRRLKERLVVDEDSVGWGLQFIEGWNRKKLVYMAAMVFGLCSFVVVMLVSFLGRDVQSGAASGSFILTFVTMGVAVTQATLHMT